MPLNHTRIGDFALQLGPKQSAKLLDYMLGYLSECDPNDRIGRLQGFVEREVRNLLKNETHQTNRRPARNRARRVL